MKLLVRFSVLLCFVACPPALAYKKSLPPTTTIYLVVRDVDTKSVLSKYKLTTTNQYVDIDKNRISLQDGSEETGIPVRISAEAEGYESRKILIYLQNYNKDTETSLAVYLSKPLPETTLVTRGDLTRALYSDTDRTVVALERLHGLLKRGNRNFLETIQNLANAYYDNTFGNKQIAQCEEAVGLYSILQEAYKTPERSKLEQLGITIKGVNDNVNSCNKYDEVLAKNLGEWKRLAISRGKQN